MRIPPTLPSSLPLSLRDNTILHWSLSYNTHHLIHYNDHVFLHLQHTCFPDLRLLPRWLHITQRLCWIPSVPARSACDVSCCTVSLCWIFTTTQEPADTESGRVEEVFYAEVRESSPQCGPLPYISSPDFTNCVMDTCGDQDIDVSGCPHKRKVKKEDRDYKASVDHISLDLNHFIYTFSLIHVRILHPRLPHYSIDSCIP